MGTTWGATLVPSGLLRLAASCAPPETPLGTAVHSTGFKSTGLGRWGLCQPWQVLAQGTPETDKWSPWRQVRDKNAPTMSPLFFVTLLNEMKFLQASLWWHLQHSFY